MKKLLLTLSLVFVLFNPAWAATYYAINAGGNWHTSGASGAWSTVSAKDASRVANTPAAPTASDDLIIDDYSGSMTINTSACRAKSVDFTGHTGTLTHQAGAILYVSGNITLGSGMTYNPNSARTIVIDGTSTVTTNGVYMGGLQLNGSSITVTLADGLYLNGTLTLTQATLKTDGASDTGGFSHSWDKMNGNNSNSKTVTLGNSTITCRVASDYAWILGSSFSTVNCGTSTIIMTGNTSKFYGGGKTYYNVTFNTGSGTKTVESANTFNNLTHAGSANKGDALRIYGDTQTVNGALNIDGNSSTNRILIYSETLGTARTIALGASATFATDSTNIDLRDITVSGGASGERDVSAISGGSGDCGGNTGVTFTTAKTWYWHVDGGNVNDSTKWYDASNGGGNRMDSFLSGTRIQLPQDTLRFDADSFDNNATFSTDEMARIGNIDFTGIDKSVTLGMNYQNLDIYGSYTLTSNIVSGFNGSSTFYGNRGACTITCGTKAVYAPTFYAYGGSYTCQDAFAWTYTLTVENGTFDANDYNVTGSSGAAIDFDATTAHTVNMGNGTWGPVGGDFDCDPSTGLTLNAEGSTITMTAATTTRFFRGGDKTFNNLTLNTSTTVASTITGSNVFNTFSIGYPKTVNFTAGTTQTVNSLSATGTAGNLITAQSTSAGSPWYIIDANGGQNTNDYLAVTDSNASPGSTFYYGANGSGDAYSQANGWAASPGGAANYPFRRIGAGIGEGVLK